MARKTNQPPALIDHCEGADADDRASLVAAFMRIWRQQSKRTVTDLHVREFVLSVFSVAKGSAGIQWSYEEIADRLVCTVSTARAVVQRASREFGLVSITEERYLRGGQGANRYRIEWSAVRSINAGLVSRRDIGKPTEAPPAGGRPAVVSQHPPAVSQHPAAVGQHPAAVTRHPYKESTSIHSSTSTSTHSLTSEHRASASGEHTTPHAPDPWGVVVSELEARAMADVAGAVTTAKRRELTPGDVMDLVERWERLKAYRPETVTIGWLYRWIVGKSRPPEDPPEPSSTSRPKRSGLADASTRREMERARIVREQRLAGRSEREIEDLVADAMARRGLVGSGKEA